MFHATAKALRTAAEQRMDDSSNVFTAQVQDVDLGDFASIDEAARSIAMPGLVLIEETVDREELVALHMEFRWAESKLMQASERLAEAQESRRKDLVALACMRRELRASFAAERSYLQAQLLLFNGALPSLRGRELELDDLVLAGAPTAAVIRELAAVRTERKFYALGVGQATAQIGRIDDSENTLEYEVANEAYDREPDGRTMRELARLRAAQTRTHRLAIKLRADAGAQLAELELDATLGEITAVHSFLTAEYEGDARAHSRMEGLRQRQVQLELSRLPEPASGWKAGLLHPVTFLRARRTTG